ncbi:MAG: tetratricopeptide repeat protein [Chloroflexota bacterium]
MPELKLSVLGSPQLERQGNSLTFEVRKALALLIYLVLTNQCHSRDALATLFWPEANQKQGRAYLRRTLWLLKKELGETLLNIERQTIGFNTEAGLWLDVTEFRHLLNGCEQHVQTPNNACLDCLAQMEAAIALYRDDFLTGFTLPDCLAFDEWQFFEAEQLRQLFTLGLEQVTQGHCNRGDYKTAIFYAQQWVGLDPLNEPAQQILIQLYQHNEQTSASLRQYELYVQRLEDELGAPPSQEMTTLYEAIKTNRVLSPDQYIERFKQGAKRESSPQTLPTKIHPSLPRQSNSFIGRTKELQDIISHIDDPACRLFALIGPGGIGKTRLALEASAQIHGNFQDGVYFVGLASVKEPQFIVSAIAESIHLTLRGRISPKVQLLNYVSQKQMLIIVDNLEHLLDGVGLLSEILAETTDIMLLATSREPLALQEAWHYPVGGFPIPTDASEYEEIKANSAIQLFLQRAQRANASFAITNENVLHITHICHLVDGMPLGLELAANWIRSLTCQEIAQEIEHNLDFLTTTVRNVPERHRSLRGVFEQTWQHLSPAEQTVLRRMSVFQGGCNREAAEQVTGATLPVLSQLVDKSLLQRSWQTDGRYEMHELIRQFSVTKLDETPTEKRETQAQHTAYYTTFLSHQTDSLKNSEREKTVAAITADIDNIRIAWQHALAQTDLPAIENAAECLWLYYQTQATFQEGALAFQQAAQALIQSKTTPMSPEQARLISILLASQGYLDASEGDTDCVALIEQGLSYLQQVNSPDKSAEAYILMCLGYVRGARSHDDAAIEASLKSNRLYREIGNHWGVARTFKYAGNSVCQTGQLAQATKLLQQGLDIARDINAWKTQQEILVILVGLKILIGDYAQASAMLDEALEINQTFVDDPSPRAYLILQRGMLAIAKGQYGQALEIFPRSLAIWEQLGLGSRLEQTADFFGMALRYQKQYKAAKQLYQENLAIVSANGEQRFTATYLRGLGCLAYDQQDYGQAEKLHREALQICQVIKNDPLTADVLRCLGHLRVAQPEKQRTDACDYYQQALRLALKQALAPIALDIFVGAAHLMVQFDHSPRALALVTCAKHHPASTFDTKERSDQLWAKLTADLPENIVASITEDRQITDWRIQSDQLIEDLVASMRTNELDTSFR